MGMSGDEDVGFFAFEEGEHATFVVARVTADVCHDDLHSLAGEQLGFGHHIAQVPTVGVAIHGHGGFELAQLLQHPGTDVACVPQLVAFGEESVYLLRYRPMRI